MDHPVFSTVAPMVQIDNDLREHYITATVDAACKGVPLAITLHGIEGSHEFIVQPCDVKIDDEGALNILGEGFHRRIHLSGPQAPAILPEIRPMDQIRDKMIQASSALAAIREQTDVLFADEDDKISFVPADMIMIASSGIFPAGTTGIEWAEAMALRADEDIIAIKTADRELQLRAA